MHGQAEWIACPSLFSLVMTLAIVIEGLDYQPSGRELNYDEDFPGLHRISVPDQVGILNEGPYET